MVRGGPRPGAGRPGWRRKCERLLCIDLRTLDLRSGILSVPGGGNLMMEVSADRVVLDYLWVPRGGAKSERNIVIGLSRQPYPLGGSRLYLRCPDCDRRCVAVYLDSNNGRFSCRKCLNLIYSVEAEGTIDRLWRKQAKAEDRLGENCARPKGMHRTTYGRIIREIGAIEARRETLIDETVQRWLAAAGITL